MGKGIINYFQDPNENLNVTSYRRIYCIAVTLNNGDYSYECTTGLFHVSNTYNIYFSAVTYIYEIFKLH